jgi:serine/threonine-protein kinase RsbW
VNAAPHARPFAAVSRPPGAAGEEGSDGVARGTPMHSRPHHAEESVSLTLTNSRPEIDRAEEHLLTLLARHGYAESSRFAVRLAVEEALTNAFQHGHKALPASATVRFDFAVGPERVTMHIEDQGPGFTPESVPDPTLEENLEIPSGRGLLLMRAYMAAVVYSGRGNQLTMVYEKPAGKAG